jgi:hypothetical protein
MTRPRSRSVYSSDPVQIKASLHPSKRRSSRVSFSTNKYNRKASYTRKRRLSPIQEGNEDKSSSPKSPIQITRKTSLRSIMNNKKSKTTKPKSIIDSIKSIFKF